MRVADLVAARVQQQSPREEVAAEPAVIDESKIDAATLPDGRINVSWYEKHEADDLQMGMVRALRQSQDEAKDREKQYIDLAEQHRVQQEAMRAAEETRQINAFHDAVDSHRAEFYGKSVDEHGNSIKLAPDHLQRRRELLAEIEWMGKRIAHEQMASGQQVALPGWNYLVKQAESRVFGEQIAKIAQDKQAADVRAQSRTIRPAAGSVGAGPARRTSAVQSNDPAQIANDPDVVAVYERNGAR
jgi:uncharacterized cysteine cluster protein YcgN (CxxCxxCC family)